MLCLCFHLALGARPSSHTIKVLQPAGSHNINHKRASIIMLCVSNLVHPLLHLTVKSCYCDGF